MTPFYVSKVHRDDNDCQFVSFESNFNEISMNEFKILGKIAIF